jgi:hypothetical protein
LKSPAKAINRRSTSLTGFGSRARMLHYLFRSAKNPKAGTSGLYCTVSTDSCRGASFGTR